MYNIINQILTSIGQHYSGNENKFGITIDDWKVLQTHNLTEVVLLKPPPTIIHTYKFSRAEYCRQLKNQLIRELKIQEKFINEPPILRDNIPKKERYPKKAVSKGCYLVLFTTYSL